MEGYQNYQQVIDALKAEYVNARNLKKTANNKKRATRAAASAKTRRDAERGSLESKLTSVKSSILSNLQTAFTNLNDSEYVGIKNELTNTKAKLAFINSEIDRLTAAHQTDPENLSFNAPHPVASATELQTLNSLRNTLTTAIYESEAVISDIYGGSDYNAIKDAFLPNQFSNTYDEVSTRFQDYSFKYENLYGLVKTEFYSFITGLYQAYEASHQLRNQLIGQSKSLFMQKSELADLLDSQASQSEITNKEGQIASTKAQMLAGAAELKQIELSINYQLSSMKMEKIKSLSENLYELGNKMRNYKNSNGLFLIDRPNTDLFISHKSFDFYEAFYYLLDQNVSKNLNNQNGQVSEFKYVFDKGRSAKEYYKDLTTSSLLEQAAIEALDYPSRIMDIAQEQNNGNGRFFSGISGFKNNVHPQVKEFYVNYFSELHQNTRNYMDVKVQFDTDFQRISQIVDYFNNELLDEHISIASAARYAKRDELTSSIEVERHSSGRYIGTDEQNSALNNAMYNNAYFIGDLEYHRGIMDAKTYKLDLYTNLYSEFYPQLESLTNAKISASASYDSAYFTWDANMRAQATIAYDYLQTLYTPVYEALGSEFADAYSSYMGTRTSKINAEALLNSTALERDQAYAFLQTALTGTAQIYIAAKDDYDEKVVIASSSDALFTIAYDNFNAAADSLFNLTAGFPDFQSAVSNWNSLDANSAAYEISTLNPAYLALQAATSALDSHLNDTFGEELGIPMQGWGLKAVKDAKEQADIDYNSAQDSIQSVSQEINLLRQQMTWVNSDPLQKRDAMMMDFDRRTKQESFTRLNYLRIEHKDIMITNMKQICQGSANNVRQRISQGFDGLLVHVKNFLDGNNLYTSRARNERNYQFEQQKSNIIIQTIKQTVQDDWYLGVIGQGAQNWVNSFEGLQSQGPLSELEQKIRHNFNNLLRQNDGINFADTIINEVVSGYPIVS